MNGKWSKGQWFDFGDKLYKVREGLIDLLIESQDVCPKSKLKKIQSALKSLDAWRSELDDLAYMQFPNDRDTCNIFYGRRF